MTAGGRWISTGPVLTHSRENIFKVIFNLRFFKSKFLFENSYNLNCICVLLNIGYQVQIFTEGKKRSCHYIAETAFCWCSCSLLCLRSLIHEKNQLWHRNSKREKNWNARTERKREGQVWGSRGQDKCFRRLAWRPHQWANQCIICNNRSAVCTCSAIELSGRHYCSYGNWHSHPRPHVNIQLLLIWLLC